MVNLLPRRRSGVRLAAHSLGAFCALAILASCERRFFEGKTLAEWGEVLQERPSSDQAAEALRNVLLDSTAVHAALGLVKRGNTYYGAWAAVALRDLQPESVAVLGELKDVWEDVRDSASPDLKDQLQQTIDELEESARPSK